MPPTAQAFYPSPLAYVFSLELDPLGTIPFPNIPAWLMVWCEARNGRLRSSGRTDETPSQLSSISGKPDRFQAA